MEMTKRRDRDDNAKGLALQQPHEKIKKIPGKQGIYVPICRVRSGMTMVNELGKLWRGDGGGREMVGH